MFDSDVKEELEFKIHILTKKDKKTAEALYKKMDEIVNSTPETIQHYKNLKHDLKSCKRVHIEKSFVLIFQVFPEKNFILFLDFDHHDKIYRR